MASSDDSAEAGDDVEQLLDERFDTGEQRVLRTIAEVQRSLSDANPFTDSAPMLRRRHILNHHKSAINCPLPRLGERVVVRNVVVPVSVPVCQ